MSHFKQRLTQKTKIDLKMHLQRGGVLFKVTIWCVYVYIYRLHPLNKQK